MFWLKVAQEQTIPTESLVIDFNPDYRDYVIYAPGDTSKYVTRLIDSRVGFGPRYLLSEILESVKEAYPTTIPSYQVEIQDIPKLDTPIVRRLGWLKKKKYPNVPTVESIDDVRKQNYSGAQEPRDWEDYAGPANDPYKWTNRPEENFEVSQTP